MKKNPSDGRIIMDDIVREEPEIKRIKPRKKIKEEKKEKKKGLKPIIIGVLIFALAVFGLNYFSSVLIKINPHEKILEIETSYKAGLEGAVLNLEKFIFKELASDFISTSQVKEFKEKASGEITIYNAYSSKSQILVANTRFETPDGKIYRINKGITIPGAKVVEGKIEPSSIVVKVYADKPGEEYNIGLTDFTIPGFKDSPKYQDFYAKSKTEMTGGFLGEAKVVSQEDVDKLREKILSYLEDTLETKLNQNIPSSFLQPQKSKKLTTIKESFNPQVDKPGGKLEMEIEAQIDSFGLLKEELENLLILSYLGEELKDKTKIVNLDELSIKAENIDFEKGEFDLLVKGKAHFVWKIDQDKLKEDLINRGVRKIEEIFSGYPEIKKATVIFRPSFWQFFPQNPKRIIIEEIY